MKSSGRATIRDVASRAGVSTATVSNVLRGRSATTIEVADRVRAAATALSYVADRSASQLRSGKAQIITILVPDLTDPFFAAVIAEVERHAQLEGYDIVVASSAHDDDVERTRLAALLSWRPSGVIIVPNSDAFPNRVQLDALGLPYVVLDRVPSEVLSDSVSAANEAATAEAAAHLLDHGHRDILVVCSTLRLENIRQRYQGIVGCFAERGLPPPPVLESGMTFEHVADGLASWLAQNAQPSALMMLTNFVTLGVLAHLSQVALKVPQDVSVIGFDDNSWMRASSPSITAVRQDEMALAAEAWAVLRDRMEDDSAPPRHRSVPCRLVMRDSVRRIGLSVPSLRTDPDALSSQARIVSP